MADDADLDQADVGRLRKAAVQVKQQPYDPTKDRESKRGWIALTLAFLFVALVSFLVVSATCGWLDKEALERIGTVLLNPVTVLVGTVVGFYFGEQRRGT